MNTIPILIAVTLSVGFCLALIPGFRHILSHFSTRKTRNFSHIPHLARHVAQSLLASAMFAGCVTLLLWLTSTSPVSSENAIMPVVFLLFGLVLAFLLVLLPADSAYRLCVDSTTGLVTWQRLTSRGRRDSDAVAYLDDIDPLQYTGGDLDLFGVDRLTKKVTGNFNGSQSTWGSFAGAELRKLASEFDAYLASFRAQDTEEARQQRLAFKAQDEASLLPSVQVDHD